MRDPNIGSHVRYDAQSLVNDSFRMSKRFPRIQNGVCVDWREFHIEGIGAQSPPPLQVRMTPAEGRFLPQPPQKRRSLG